MHKSGIPERKTSLPIVNQRVLSKQGFCRIAHQYALPEIRPAQIVADFSYRAF
ncbi:MAG: hypothetical protein VKO64_09375 [Candidatus Sericytochromatia bacterium]|nr:hypothetical protein [Candidatus Sericytochromatia bacterium]